MDIKLDKTFPTVDVGPDITINEDTAISLSGNSHDNIQIVNYTWVLFDYDLKTLSGANPQYVFHSPGEYNVTLIVADSAQNSASDSYTIIVVDVTDPVADAGDDIFIYEGKLAAFDGLNSADNVGVIGYTWSFVDGFPQTLNGVNPTYAFSSAGAYEVTLTVSDEQGNFATDVVLVTVIDTTWPLAEAGIDQVVEEDTLVYFDGSGSSDNVGIASYVWTFIDGEAQSIEGKRTEYYFETPGVYLITLTVTDVEGNISNDFVSVVVQATTEFEIDVRNQETVVEDVPEIIDDGDGLSDKGEFSHELDSDAGFDSNVDGAGNVENYEESTSPEGFAFFGYSLADLLMIPFFVFVVCYILYYKRFFNWITERGKK
jgi:PKD repeat protein